MTTSANRFPRGSEWRQWDLHIHTPASFHWQGERFGADEQRNTQLVDQMIEALNAAQPAVFALMDYWTFDGWFRLQDRLQEPGAPALQKLVFPGIELRLTAPADYRLNAHVLFCDKVTRQTLNDFRSALTVELMDRPLSEECLIQLARRVGADKLKCHSFKKSEVDADDRIALLAGSVIAEINPASYRQAINRVPNERAIGFMPFDTSDGLADVDWEAHYAFVMGMFESSLIFESRKPDLRGAFVNEETPGNSHWIANFQAALGNKPRLCVSGSDAHHFKGIPGNNDKRGYGDFPSGKATWLKADPSFEGLLQAIMEPAKRSYIGPRPPKLLDVDASKTYYIDSLQISKAASGSAVGTWLDGCKLPLNPDLIAIIGNKGSGKSALADVIALLGNSQKRDHFSFLQKNRFRGKSGEPAKHFIAELTWKDGSPYSYNLNEDPPPDKVEMVRYIPQGHFEALCNEHISGRSTAFEDELRAVIFSHAPESVRLGALDFDQLIEQQELGFRDRLGEARKRLKRLNEEVVGMEQQLQPQMRRSLIELLALKQKQIEEHHKIRPPEQPPPAEQMNEPQLQAATRLEAIAQRKKQLVEQAQERVATQANLARKQQAIRNLNERLRSLELAFNQFQDTTTQDLVLLGIPAEHLTRLTINRQSLEEIAAALPLQQAALDTSARQDTDETAALQVEQSTLSAQLNAPQLAYQQNLQALETWSKQLSVLIGSAESPETQRGLEARIAQIDELPARLASRQEQRLHCCAEIFEVLDEQRDARAQLFAPVQDLIQRNQLIRDDYKLQFQATLSVSPDTISESLFALIKQNAGEFKGDEAYLTVRSIADRNDLSTKAGMMAFITELCHKVELASGGGSPEAVGIANALRKDKAASDVYDLLFGLPFLEPRYSLLFQDTQIEQLSPGQRGALLLIFYLLVDKGRNPIILDQPEENLDNQTVVSLLVPVLNEAKKTRQIIMVTHNPNLAVVCDAEQVIYSSFDRKGGSKITYLSGSIENPAINLHTVNVLEGTKPAFDNRRIKYQ